MDGGRLSLSSFLSCSPLGLWVCFGGRLWSSGDILVTFPGIISGYGFADGITDVVYRGHLGYILGFRVYVHYVGCKTELFSSARNITHSTSALQHFFSESFSGYNLHLLNLCRRGWPTHSGNTAMLAST